MLTRIEIKNFKKFENASIELGKTVVFIGPNNSGKSTALQALALWDVGLRRWNEKRREATPSKRPGVTINRNDLIAVPTTSSAMLWRDLHVRNVDRSTGKQETHNIRIDILVEGITGGKIWKCGLEFDYANDESFYCRPLRNTDQPDSERMLVPIEASSTSIAFLPPMSGLAATEPKWEEGRIRVLLGEGQTAQVLRNLCYQIYQKPECWVQVTRFMKRIFGVEIVSPRYIKERGEITMSYKERGIELDLSSSGRGLQQTLLLLAHLYANPNTVLLLDEPDAHLEILRQRQIYQLISDVADAQGSQVIAASHSEIILNEAAGRDTVVAFIGTPHTLVDRGSQLMKSLTDIGFDQYYQAELKGWILYLEGPSDLAILRSFAEILEHEAITFLDDPFVNYVSTNLPQKARDHFNGIREAKPDIVGVAIFDRLDKNLQTNTPLFEVMWKRREIENYLCSKNVLLAFAGHELQNDLFGQARISAMEEAVSEVSKALKVLGAHPWSHDIKASDEVLRPIFELYSKRLGLRNVLQKSDYHKLAGFVKKDEIDAEVIEKLNLIVGTARSANPRR